MVIVIIFVMIFLLVTIVLVTLVLNWPMTAGLAKVGDNVMIIYFDTFTGIISAPFFLPRSPLAA